MDVKNAFFHGDLKKDIYMKPPPGCVLLLVYVDDIIITRTDSSLITSLQQLKDSFHMKDIGTLTYFLGLEVQYVASGVFLNQHKYTQNLISLAGIQDSSTVDTPLELNVKYRREEGYLLLDPTMFRQLVGGLNYLTITRLDKQVSQFMQEPRHLHLVAVRRIIRDSDWAGCPNTCRSVSSWCMFLGDSLISWKSKKQDRVSTACYEVVWLRGLLAEIGFPQYHDTPLHADNINAIQITTNLVFHERIKHIEVDCHYI
ncbi:uncharacterized protein LOC114074231 [Solanum pennellii]|uniref:Uncharacterized protein LOC114074231 n=1 Tax=Solanum pennellii TaxID=28526 RepID=A0ABM1UWP3_SOLPN|nr:uncharacterized protein LOC114074231 [Solanum pennellii]